MADQFPQWADLPVTQVLPGGWDNRTFRLGQAMAVRLPSAGRYAAAVEKEQRWLPRLAPRLPAAIPTPLALGAPGEAYPWPWSVNLWLAGEPADPGRDGEAVGLAQDLAGFLGALRAVDATDGPPAGAHSFFRGGPLVTYDKETRAAIAALGERIDAAGATALWREALSTIWPTAPVWVHGDVAAGNLLTAGGRLSAVIDFGQACVGDPACDLVIAWTLFSGAARRAFVAATALDAATWARARGWALWKALIVLAEAPGANPAGAQDCARIVAALVAEHRGAADRPGG